MTSDPERLKALLAHASRNFTPLKVALEVTHRCHLACHHCYLQDHHDWDSRGRELTTDELRSVIEQLRSAGCLFLAFTGGEVFLRSDILELVGHARELGMAVSLLTTGTLLSPRVVEALAALHPWRVELTLYSTDSAVHDGITGRAGSHTRTMTALEQLRAAGLPVSIKAPIMGVNFASLPGLEQLAGRLDVPFISDPTITPRHDHDGTPTEDRLSQDQLVEFFSRAEAWPFAKVNPRLPQAHEGICAIGRSSCLIGPFGDVYACSSLRTPVGNLKDHSFTEIWNGPELARLRGMTAGDLAICGGCEKFAYCNRCAALALDECGDLGGPSSWACAMAAAKERAAGVSVRPSAAERAGVLPGCPDPGCNRHGCAPAASSHDLGADQKAPT